MFYESKAIWYGIVNFTHNLFFEKLLLYRDSPTRLTSPKCDFVKQISSFSCPGSIFLTTFVVVFFVKTFKKRALPVVHLLVMKLKINHVRGSLGSAVMYST